RTNGAENESDLDIEKQIAGIWLAVLGTGETNPEATFPTTEGQSISAVGIASGIEDELGMTIDVAVLFEDSTSPPSPAPSSTPPNNTDPSPHTTHGAGRHHGPRQGRPLIQHPEEVPADEQHRRTRGRHGRQHRRPARRPRAVRVLPGGPGHRP